MKINSDNIVINDYQKVAFNPKFAVNPNLFNAKLHCLDMDNSHHKALTWHKDECYFKLFDFKEKIKLLWQLDLQICYAKFNPNQQYIWLVNCINENELQVLLYDYEGNELASQSLIDDYGYADCMITLLPEDNHIMIMLAYGQDGSCDYQLVYKDNQINVIKKLDDNLSFLFCFNDNKNATLLDFYENTIHITSYPDFAVLKSYQFDETMAFDNLQKITDELWLYSDGINFRHYLFNAETLQIQKEIIIQGYEPTLDEYDEISSQISAMNYENGKLYFCIWQECWATADFNVNLLNDI